MSHLEPLIMNDIDGGNGSRAPSDANGNNIHHHHNHQHARNNNSQQQHQHQTPVRRHSLPGQRSSGGSLKRRFRDMNSFVLQECVAVAIWSIFVPILSYVVNRLMEKARNKDYYWSTDEGKERDYPRFIVSLIAWCWLHLLPRKLRSASTSPTTHGSLMTFGLGGGTPGFVLSHIWLLLRVEELFHMYPNLGCRICEWRLGRIPKRAMFMALMIHSIIPCLVWSFLSWFSSSSSLSSPLFSLRYSADLDEFGLVYFAKELLVSILFPLVVMVLPALLKLNGLPEWLTFFCLYPIYSTGVDCNDRGSTLSSGAVLAQALYFWRFDSEWRLGAQLLGSLIAGAIMATVFPDDPVA